MNPIPEEPKAAPANNPELKPMLDPATFVPKNSSPQADLAALEAIGALEAEEDTSKVARAAQPVEEIPPVIDIMTPFVSEQPTIAVKDVLSVEASKNVPMQPVQTNTDPFVKQKKSSKTLILILIAVIVLIGGAAAAYFTWKSI